MNDKIIELNKKILMKLLYALQFPEDVDENKLTKELDDLEKQKKKISTQLGGMSDEYNKKIEDYKQRLVETKRKYDLNLDKNPLANISDKIEDYKEYKSIYNEHYEYIKSVKELHISKKKYDGVEYDYLITKI